MSSEYKVAWSSPSNIALVKYWGKHGNQLPNNPSISFSLSSSVTNFSISIKKKLNGSVQFYFFGEENLKFKEKIIVFLETIKPNFSWISNYHLEIHSSNTFPHSGGIASSASSMSALCLSLLSIDEHITGRKRNSTEFYRTASELSRLASGSASRSVFGGFSSWGECLELEGSSDLFASNFYEVHDYFKDYCDSILIVDDQEKSVSSRAGHGVMINHPFREQRYKKAQINFCKMLSALRSGNSDLFIEIVEEEALTLHALMMTSNPSYLLLKPESLWLIDEIKKFREKEKIPVCFTIDAGPNIHLLYPKTYKIPVCHWIDKVLSAKCISIIHDEVGSGPKKLEEIV